MNRPLRIRLASITILVIGLVAAAGVFVYTADYDRYKGLIEKAVMDATGRQLAIKGGLSIVMSLPPELSALVLGPAGLLVPLFRPVRGINIPVMSRNSRIKFKASTERVGNALYDRLQ